MRRSVPSRAWAPVAAAALLGAAYLIVAPATADMAAQTYRTGLWERVGWTVWNAQWYAGHHVPGYSLLYPPLAALAGARLTGVAAGVVAVAIFGRLAFAHAPSAASARTATWLFAGGAMSNVIVGRMPFTLGLALGLAAWLADERGRRPIAAGLSLACVWASPVAGLFLVLAAAGRWLATVPSAPASGVVAASRGALAIGLPAVAGGLLLVGLFPEGGTERFVATAFWPMLAVSLAGLVLIVPDRRGLRAGAALSIVLLVLAFLLSTPLGQNALRIGVVLGPSVLALGAWERRPVAAVLAVGAALVYLQWLPAVRAVAEAHDDPSVQRAFYDEPLAVLRARARPGDRVEIPLTRNHWEAAYVAPEIAIARGWERQLDVSDNALFYDGEPLTPARYGTWLHARAVRFVALPAAPLDASARGEAALLRRGVPFLREVHRSRRWRLWEVERATPPVSPPARVDAATVDSVELETPRPATVRLRQHHTRYWVLTRGAGCVRAARGPNRFTEVELPAAGHVRLEARFSVGRALGGAESCRP